MLFNSIEFAIFLPVVFIVYWFLLKNKIKLQNFFLLLSSYIFYGWWDWRFLSLIFISSSVDYFVGLKLQECNIDSKRKKLLFISVFINLSILVIFKYYNFFITSFIDAFSLFGRSLEISRLNLVLPVGISFYTFQTLSYTIDIYKKKFKPTKNLISFFSYVSFFPQLVAGPIERAKNLLPQFETERIFDYHKSVDGCRQILWGLFKKIVIADNCAIYANEIFNNYSDYSGSTLFVGAVFFSFQIYGDFSGYSDIAIGTARLFGFNLRKNFSFPYFSRNIGEFWRRWHISLSSWFRDYLYFPLGGSRGTFNKTIRNTFIIFVVSGFWHGANWTFIIWGILNAIYFLPSLILNKNRQYLDIVAKGNIFPSFKELFSMLTNFILVVFAWIIFRSENINSAYEYLAKIFSKSIFIIPSFRKIDESLIVILFVLFFIIIEWLGRTNKYAIEKFPFKVGKVFRWSFYYLIILLIIRFSTEQQDFIYFQF